MNVEILSPCGGPESVDAALRTGADAVYLGAKNFSARHNAVNFSDGALAAAVRECHRHGVLVYLAFNTVVMNSELREAAELLALACELSVDGLIIQDMAVYEMARAACPDMPLHASTQMTLHTPCGADAARELGFSRIVAARELSLGELRALCNRGVEVEAFAHGALCMSVSGQCYLSAMIGGRSANRGLCAGACRLPFSAKGIPAGKYALSLKDMSYCPQVKELEDAGIASLKIEGRMKRPEYVAAATDAMSRARNGEPFDCERLRAVFSRSGFTDGYLTGKLGAEMFGAREKEDVEAASGALPGLRRLYDRPEKRFRLDLWLTASSGEPLTLRASDGAHEITVSDRPPEAALTRETPAESLTEQLGKLGGTLYEPGKIGATVSPGLSVPRAAVNGLRRRAVEELDRLRIASFSPKSFDLSRLTLSFPQTKIRKLPRLRVRVERPEQLALMRLSGEQVVVSLYSLESFGEKLDPASTVLALPRFDTDEQRTKDRLVFAKSRGFEMVECGNIGQISLVRSLRMIPLGGFGLNVANTLSARHYFAEGLSALTLSPELRASALSAISASCPGCETGAIIYGRLPLMLTRNCPIAAELGCKRCTGCLTDRTGAVFPIICRREIGIYELLNSRPVFLADRLNDFNLDFADLYFSVETPEEAADILEKYRSGAGPMGEFTRGLYYRGVE